MLYNKQKNSKNTKDREPYIIQRNKTRRLYKKSIAAYFEKKKKHPKNCNDSNGSNFWKTIKSLFSYRNSSKAGKITLKEGGRIINTPQKLLLFFNWHFGSVANHIGINDPLPEELHEGTSLDATISKHDSHESINLITRNITLTEQFRFKRVTHNEVLTRLTTINVNKANLRDLIAAQFGFNSSIFQHVWPWNMMNDLFYITSSFVHHLKLFGGFRLELLSGNARFGWKLAIFCPVWPWNLIDDLEKQ